MRLLRYSINVTLDGCVDHRAGVVDEETHRYTAESLAGADALIFGRVTYQLMEYWREPVPAGSRPEWMEPFSEMINAAKKYVASSTLEDTGWNSELIRGDVVEAVRKLKEEPGNGLYVGGVQVPLALAEHGLIDEYEFIVQPRIAGHGPTLFAGLSSYLDLKPVNRVEFSSGAVATTYVPH